MMSYNRRQLRVVAATLFFCAIAWGSASATEHTTFCFEDISVVDVVKGTVLPMRDVVVTGGKIVSVSASQGYRPEVGSGHTVIGGRGKYLMPGFIDMHMHLNDRLLAETIEPVRTLEDADILSPNHLAIYLSSGVTTVQVMHGAPEMLALREQIARGDAVGPRLVVGSPRLDGLPPADPFVRIVATAAEGTAVVDEMKSTGYDFIKVYSELGQSAYDAIIDRSHQLGLRVDGHLPRFLPLEHGLHGQDHIAHMEEFVYFAKKFDADEIAEFTRLTRQAGIGVTPTLIVFKNVLRSVSALDDFLGSDAMRFVDPISLDSCLPRNNSYLSEHFQAQKTRQRLAQYYEFMKKLTLSFHNAGLPMTVGTDAPAACTVPGVSFHDEMDELVGVGISTADVLRMATLEAAKAMRMDAQTGTIDVGKTADLVVLDANPLENIANTRRVSGVMAQGVWLSKAALDANLQHALSQYKLLDQRLHLEICRLGVCRPPLR
jgi:imidazolonepropionase-like amidohydrolase